MPDENPPDTTSGNPFALVAYLLFQVRHSLEDPGSDGRPPRWIRIARARQATGSTDYIAIGVREAINGFAEALSFMVELTLDIQEILVQTDAAKALVEVTADFVDAAVSPPFINGINTLTGADLSPERFKGMRDAISKLKGYMNYIPDPEDVLVLGHELYRLLAIEQLPIPRRAGTYDVDEAALGAEVFEHIDVERSGKVRLLQWAFNQDLKTFGLGSKANPESATQQLTRYGSRRLWKPSAANKLPARTAWYYRSSNGSELIYEFLFDAREDSVPLRTQDLRETYELLEKMGYTLPNAPDRTLFGDVLIKRLRAFQAINELALSGELDNPTINRLMNLDFQAKNVRRARPFDADQLPAGVDVTDPAQPPPQPIVVPRYMGGAFKLINPGADTPAEQGLRVLSKPGSKYSYYEAGAPLPPAGPAQLPTGGWISDSGVGVVQGFVALQSRVTMPGNPNRFEGGILSEGEAVSGGRFFFAARHTEPWVAGRKDEPKSGALFVTPNAPNQGRPPEGSVTRLYQWVPLGWLDWPQGWDLFITATVHQRSLYVDRSRTTGLPDQGVFGVEFYGSTYFKGDLGTRRDPTAQSAELRAASRFTEPYPNAATSTAMLNETEVAQKRNWVLRAVTDVRVPRGAAAMLVILEGHYQSAWDIDAYFDEVAVYWSFKKAA